MHAQRGALKLSNCAEVEVHAWAVFGGVRLSKPYRVLGKVQYGGGGTGGPAGGVGRPDAENHVQALQQH